ncbi:hypothetical protein [Tsukamurella pseudospumae]|uniref:hypothetical protein n=1 Tax=Tsukamurella pseudospumae TaxID=239498 RepID=UPI000837F0B4|nr:hypothetical protein [Tsukamurella pseudospumae]
MTTNHAAITVSLRPSITTRMLMGWILQPRITIDGRPVTVDHPTTLTLQVKATVHRITATTAPRWRPPTPTTPLANRGTSFGTWHYTPPNTTTDITITLRQFGTQARITTAASTPT